jgi:hypothetical protein
VYACAPDISLNGEESFGSESVGLARLVVSGLELPAAVKQNEAEQAEQQVDPQQQCRPEQDW